MSWTLDEFVTKFRPADENGELFDEAIADVLRDERVATILGLERRVELGAVPFGRDGTVGQWLLEQAEKANAAT